MQRTCCLRNRKQLKAEFVATRLCGGIGRRKGLKIPRWRYRAGSSPATSTNDNTFVLSFFCRRHSQDNYLKK